MFEANDLFWPGVLCFYRELYFFYWDEFQMVVSDFIFAMTINFVV